MFSSKSDVILTDFEGNQIRPLTSGQEKLIKAIDKYDIIFVNGPAGTGKSFISMCKAIRGLQDGIYEKVVITRPVVESGEELGFLPGTVSDKIAPYMKPLYEMIDAVKGPAKARRATNKKTAAEVVPWEKKVEVSPLAYMRGMTIKDSFIVADEMQNCTPQQIKLLLTRIGNGSKMVLCGDATQTDLIHRIKSGFSTTQDILSKVKGIGIVNLTEDDIVRHGIVRDIIIAYSKYENAKFGPGVMSNRE